VSLSPKHLRKEIGDLIVEITIWWQCKRIGRGYRKHRQAGEALQSFLERQSGSDWSSHDDQILLAEVQDRMGPVFRLGMHDHPGESE
jgi:hypothetical protein